MAVRKNHPRSPRQNAVKDLLEDEGTGQSHAVNESQARIEIFGREMVEKRVKAIANSGRVYLPPEWVGRKVKIIRID